MPCPHEREYKFILLVLFQSRNSMLVIGFLIPYNIVGIIVALKKNDCLKRQFLLHIPLREKPISRQTTSNNTQKTETSIRQSPNGSTPRNTGMEMFASFNCFTDYSFYHRKQACCSWADFYRLEIKLRHYLTPNQRSRETNQIVLS